MATILISNTTDIPIFRIPVFSDYYIIFSNFASNWDSFFKVSWNIMNKLKGRF